MCSSTFELDTCHPYKWIFSLVCQESVCGEAERQWVLVMLQKKSCSDKAQWTNLLIWCVFVLGLPGLQVPTSKNLSAMTTKLHQKLIEDIRLHKRLVGLFDEQDKGSKARPGSYQSPLRRVQSGRMNEAFREDDEDKFYIWGDRRNSRLERERNRPRVMEASSSRYELVPYETRTRSESMRPFEGVPVYYPYDEMAEYGQHRVNSINKRAPAVSNGIAGTRHRNSDRADDGRLLGGFANPMHNHNHIAKKSHHRHRRSFDLGEVNRQCFSDSDIAKNNAHEQGQGHSYLQITETPRDARKRGHLLKEQGGDGGRDLLKGTMDLEESLRILARFQKAAGSLRAAERPRQSIDFQELFPRSYEAPSRYSFDARREHPRLSLDGRELAKTSNFDLRDAIRSSLNRQKMLYKKSDVSIQTKDTIRPLESIRGSNSGTQQVDGKKRIPNVIARLMGLEEMPSDSKPGAGRIAVQASRSVEGEATSRALRPRPQESTPRPISLEPRKPTKDNGSRQQSYIFMDGEEYHDTIKAALRRIKQQAPPKPSFEEELSLKLNRLQTADRQMSEEPKTLKQILETLQMKGILHSSPDQAKPKAGNDDGDFVRREEDVRVLKPVIETKNGTRKAKDHHERPFQASSLPEIETPTTRNPGLNPSNKESFKGVSITPPPSIVVIKPVTVNPKAQNLTKATELHQKTTARNSKQGNLLKNTDAKKKNTLSELNRSADDGESKKKNNRNSSVSDGPPQRPKQRVNGGLQKQIKSQKPRPPPPSPGLHELRKKGSERISKTNTNKGATSKTEKQKRIQAPKTHSKPKVSGSRPRSSLPRASTDRISSDFQGSDTRSSHMRAELSQIPIDQNPSSISSVENNIEENREKTPENPDVEGIEPASEDENPVSKFSSMTDQHKNNGLEDAVTASTISPVSVLEVPAEADPQQVEEEEEELTDDEIHEEEEQDEDPNHIKDSDDRTDIFFDSEEIDCKDYVWQMISKNVMLMGDASMEAEQTELYSRLHHKLEEIEKEIEIASFCGLEAGKRWQASDALERRLVLDCVKELLQRKKRLRLQMKRPLLSSRRRRVSLGLKRASVPDLVQELREDVAELRSYQQVGPGPSHDDARNETFGEDFLYGVLQKDLGMANLGLISIWNPSWENGMYGEEEAHDCARDIESMVFDELLEEIISDFGLG